MKLKEILGLTNYLFAKDHFSSYEKFKLQRYFVDNFRVTQGNIDFRTQPTWQNFKHDELLANAKANGQFNIWCTQGAFDWQGVQGKQGKVMPIRDADNALDQNSWKDISALCKQIAIRYADDTAHLLSEAKVFQGSPTYLSNTPKSGLNLVDAIEIQNEWDFKQGWSGATRTITPEEYAVCFKVCYDSIRSVSKTMRVIMGGGISPIESTFTRFLAKLKELYAAEGKPMPTDFYLCFHWYMRNGSQDQGGGTAGITPEEAKAYEFGLMMDALCQTHGLPGWYCTETGWATDDSKQSAPILEGFTREQSQGILMIRLALIWGACKYHKGISFWHVRDDYDSPPYAKGGVNYKDWSAKPARTICEEFLANYGEYEVVDFFTRNGIFYSELKTETDPVALMWTDKNKIGEASPMPKQTIIIVEPPTPPMRNIKKSGTTLVWSDTNERIIIKELNSPETLLIKPLDEFKSIIDYAVSVGLNTIYCSLYAGDKYSATLHPYNGTKEVTIPNGTKKQMGNPTSGFNMPKINDWKTKLEYAASKGMILHLLLSEKENHHVKTNTEEQAFIDMMVQNLDHLPVIWDREEVPLGMDGFIINSYTYLQSKTNNVTAIHNNTGERPWVGHGGIIDVISIQADISSFDGIIRTETANGFAAYSSEMTGGFTTTDTAKAQRIRDAGSFLSSGAGIYIPSLDQDATLAQLKSYENVFKTLSGNTTTPPMATLKVSTSPNPFPGNIPLDGSQFPSGTKLYIYWDGEGKTPLKFMPSGQSESGKPYEYKGGAAVTFPDGTHTVTVTDATGAKLSEATFTVGNTTPPPVDIKGTSFALKPDGKIEFTFEGGVKKLVATI